MYKIDKTPYGFRVTSAGMFTLDEIDQLKHDLLDTLASYDRPFSLLLDARKLVPPAPPVRDAFFELHASVWQLSCRRVAFVVESPVAKGQVQQMHYSASPDGQDRIIDATRCPDWEAQALAWVTEGIEPNVSATAKMNISRIS